MTGAASLLGVALAAGGAYATSGSLSLTDAPGQQLKISGIAPAADTANQNALDHANKNAKGLFGTSDKDVVTDETTTPKVEGEAETETDVKSNSAADVTVPREAAKNASTVKGSETGATVKEWAQTKNDVEVVIPDAAVEVKVDADAKAEARGDNR